MTEFAWVSKLMDFGGLGLACLLMYSLINKWAAKFLESQDCQTKQMAAQALSTAAQASATGELATAVRGGQADQREILMAVRLLADRIETQKGYLVAIDDNCRKKECQ